MDDDNEMSVCAQQTDKLLFVNIDCTLRKETLLRKCLQREKYLLDESELTIQT